MNSPDGATAPTTFLFDLDGTLVDSLADLATAVNRLRHECALPPLDAGTVRSCVGDGATMLVRRALPDGLFSPRRLHRFLQLYSEHLFDRTVVYPGIIDFLAAHPRAAKAVVSNKPRDLSLRLLRALDLERYFPVVIGGDSVPEKKPAPAPVLAALQQLTATPASAMMIGDHHTDLLAGHRAGVRTCFCAWGFGRRGEAPFDFRAESAAELLRLFPGGGRR